LVITAKANVGGVAVSRPGRAARGRDIEARIDELAVEDGDVVVGSALRELRFARRSSLEPAVEANAGSNEERSSDARDELRLVFTGGDPDVDVAELLVLDRLKRIPEIWVCVLPAVASLMPYTFDWPGDEAGSSSTIS